MVNATGTSLLHGNAAVNTAQHAWHWTLQQEKPSHSGLIPIKPQGNNNGAPGLQQNCKLRQHKPAYNGRRKCMYHFNGKKEERIV